MRILVLVAAVLTLASCGGRDPAPSQSPASSQSTTAAESVSAAGDHVTVYIRTVDLAGKPLSGMTPIASRQPNVFDPPIASGAATDAEGNGAIDLPLGERLYVRAWDPALTRFANNFLEVLTDSSGQTARTDITMVEGADLIVTLMSPALTPIADVPVEIMMAHPKYGPWWPVKARSNGAGQVNAASIPAGQFHINISAPGYGKSELRDVKLDPGKLTNLGALQLKAH